MSAVHMVCHAKTIPFKHFTVRVSSKNSDASAVVFIHSKINGLCFVSLFRMCQGNSFGGRRVSHATFNKLPNQIVMIVIVEASINARETIMCTSFVFLVLRCVLFVIQIDCCFISKYLQP